MSGARRFLTLLIIIIVCGSSALAQSKPSKTNPPQAGLLREPPAPPACLRQNGKSINMLVLGDSIMWGQGLKEEEKISYRIQDWLCTATQRPVKLWREAHSGAVLEVNEPTLPSECVIKDDNKEEPEAVCGVAGQECGGEVNISEPTIQAQLAHAREKLNLAEVDFVLMDGCINDFNIRNLLNVANSTRCVDTRAKAVCYERMKRFLTYALPLLPNAHFIVTGYYPVFTERSARNVLFRFIAGWLISRPKQKWFFPNAKKELFQGLTRVSQDFGSSSNDSLRLSIHEVNGTGDRISFIPVYMQPPPDPPDGQFGSPSSGFAGRKRWSMLWTSRFNSTGRRGFEKFFYVTFKLGFHMFRANDQVFSDRGRMCKYAGKKGLAGLMCRMAAFGHPNTKGVDEYVRVVTMELQRLLAAGWLREAGAR